MLKILDLFCGAGGAAYGYWLACQDAGIECEITGVDIKPMPRYPYRFVEADAMTFPLEGYDFIHASPPCQAYTSLNAIWKKKHPELIGPTRKALKKLGKPYVIENVPGAPLENPFMLCGTMFGLRIIRHRLFEIYPPLYFAPHTCKHDKAAAWHGRPATENEFIAVTGHFSGVAVAQKVMEIDWMGQKELAQAIPPAYTEYIGKHLLAHLSPGDADGATDAISEMKGE